MNLAPVWIFINEQDRHRSRHVTVYTSVPQGADNQKYDEVPEIPRLLTIIEEYLGDYNAQVRQYGSTMGDIKCGT